MNGWLATDEGDQLILATEGRATLWSYFVSLGQIIVKLSSRTDATAEAVFLYCVSCKQINSNMDWEFQRLSCRRVSTNELLILSDSSTAVIRCTHARLFDQESLTRYGGGTSDAWPVSSTEQTELAVLVNELS